MSEIIPFGFGAWVFISLYIGSLLVVGWFAYGARKENTLKDFYLAGSGFGFTVLLLTLYASQYSGNSLFGFTGMTYRIGYSWILSLHFMISIVVFYQLIAVRLFRLAKSRAFITPVDFLQYRFQSRAISLIAAIVMILALSNFLLAQLMAMGRAMQGLAGAHGELAYQYGVGVLALIMVIYGTLGGIRAVAWTDMLQGLILTAGFIMLLIMLHFEFGPLSLATEKIIASNDTDMLKKIQPPDAARMREWLSYVLIVGMGGALYPHAIQRIYSARSEKVLRRSLSVMVFLPFVTILIAVTTGIYAIAYIGGLQGAASDQVLGSILRIIQESSMPGYMLVVVLFAAILSAIMSTADSALLSISSMLSKDVYAKFINREAKESQLTLLGKFCSWILVIILVGFAIALREHSSLVKLLDRKFDILVQLVPAFMLGIRWKNMQTLPTLVGMIAGLIIALSLAFGPFEFVRGGKVWGFHPGLYGLLINFLIVYAGSIYISRTEDVSD